MSGASKDDLSRQRTHAERMLARAERREKQAAKLIEKWKERIAELDRTGIAAQQPTLWPEIQDDGNADD